MEGVHADIVKNVIYEMHHLRDASSMRCIIYKPLIY